MDGPSLPEAGARIWEWFRDLDAQRQYAVGFGAAVPQPIGYAEIDAYFRRVAGRNPEAWQIRLITTMDAMYRSIVNGDEADATVSGAAGMKEALTGE